MVVGDAIFENPRKCPAIIMQSIALQLAQRTLQPVNYYCL